ncbi:MAG: MBL fold metallo-hydrolase [Proteobacteria bacterium]|nr:MBL fold metallo-hydrolase [Pseudomonadota bacterium]
MPEMTIEDGFQMDAFKTQSGKDIKLYCIKHGSLRIRYGETEFEIDPVTDLNGVVTDYTKLPKADYIIVTHEHYDHYDKTAIDALTKEGSTIITNASVAGMYGKGDVMANGDEKTLRDDIHLKAVPAYNTTVGHEQYHPKGRDNGFILTLDNFNIYIAGDTEDIPEMADIKDIDVALMPCNQPYTMTPEQLNKAARTVQPKVLFPYHYGQTDMKQVSDLLKDSGVDVRIRNYQ